MRIAVIAVLGLLFMTFVALDLVFFGVLALDSVMITVLMVIGLVGGGVLGWLAGRQGSSPV